MKLVTSVTVLFVCLLNVWFHGKNLTGRKAHCVLCVFLLTEQKKWEKYKTDVDNGVRRTKQILYI